jgi:hypothetical protein
MGVVAPALSLLLLFILSPLSLQAETPSEIIDIFYTSRKFLHGTALEIIGAGSLSSAGKRAAVDILYDYTVIEVATESRARAYAEVEVRLKSLEEVCVRGGNSGRCRGRTAAGPLTISTRLLTGR